MLVWFAVLALLGIWGIAQQPRILLALNPRLRASPCCRMAPGAASSCSGAVFLAVTGTEALYADMGHFGRTALRTAWLRLVFPALLLNYFGQGALLLGNPGRSKTRSIAWRPNGASIRSWSRVGRDDHRLAGGDLGRVLDHPPGYPARLSAAARGASHLRAGDRPGLRAAHQRAALLRRNHPGARFPVIGQSWRCLWHRGQRDDGDHHRAGVPLHARAGAGASPWRCPSLPPSPSSI